MYQSTKTYGHNVGISCAFRQWRAQSHCNKLHGYALSFKFIFQSQSLDNRNWVVDFGGLKVLKERLLSHFDHKTIVAEDDPFLDHFIQIDKLDIIDINILPSVGCEAFAKHAYDLAVNWLKENGLQERVTLASCEVSEHGANSALYIGNK